MLALNVVGIFVSEVFWVGVNGCVVTDGRSRVEGDLNENRGRVLVIRPLILLSEELDCFDLEEELDVSYSGGGGGLLFLDVVCCFVVV